ncbi:MAG: DUF1684 domain-containing protein [Deltaproteobacteria bacterium]|nr:MAG: DUF1684 domain-containing protein [Deltaproteobacteria bacterium]
MRSRLGKCVVLLVVGFLFLALETPFLHGKESQGDAGTGKESVMKWRKERDVFFRTHQRSPLSSADKKRFKGLTYFSFDPQYHFEGRIRREIFHINDPKYYATFLTNKGTNKRYIRYGKFHFSLDGKEYAVEVYKSILSDILFIPFKDLTNGKETYEGGRYIDAEILPGYKMVLDFNMAYFPSCAYNDKFTCAIPSKENFLNVTIKAGEKGSK